MSNWFTVKVKYTKQLDNGGLKRVSDAEARIYEELGSIIRGEFQVIGIARTEFQDVFQYEEEDVWYKCKISYEDIDNDSEKAKKVAQNFLVTASSVKEAFDRINESLSGLMVDYSILSISLSPIVDIFPYNEKLYVDSNEEGIGEVKQ